MAIVARIKPAQATVVAPFDEPAATLSFCDTPLKDLQEKEATAAGLTVVDVDESAALPPETVCVISADTLVSQAVFSRGAAAGPGIHQVVVSRDAPLHAFLAPHSRPAAKAEASLQLPVFFGAFGGQTVGGEDPERWFKGAAPLLLAETEADVDRTAPYGAPPHQLRIPAAPAVAGRITHWLHALNLGLTWVSVLRRRHGAVGRKNALLGTAKIHPTALVEGSVLADGAEVEAGASVIDSYIGADAKIADHAIFVRCAVDKGCHTLIDTHMRRVIAYEGSTLSNLGTADLLLGRKIFITTGVAYFHPGPGQSIIVDGEDSLRPVLGGAVGHGAILGARTLFPAGQSVPAGVTIVGRPDEGISRLTPEGLARAHSQHGDRERDA